MKYVPMTDDEWAKLLGDDYPNGLYYGFYGQIEQAVIARIESQGLVTVPTMAVKPKDDAYRVALIQRMGTRIDIGEFMERHEKQKGWFAFFFLCALMVASAPICKAVHDG